MYSKKKARDKVFWCSIDSIGLLGSKYTIQTLFLPTLFFFVPAKRKAKSGEHLSLSFYKTRKLLYQRRDDRPIYFAAPTSWLPLYLHALKKRADYYLLLKTLQSFLFVFCYCIGNLLIQEKVFNFCYSSIFSCYIKVGTIFFSSLRIYRRPKIMPTKQMNRAKSRKC